MKKLITILVLLLFVVPSAFASPLTLQLQRAIAKKKVVAVSNGFVGYKGTQDDEIAVYNKHGYGWYNKAPDTVGQVTYGHCRIAWHGADTIVMALYDASGNRVAYGSASISANDSGTYAQINVQLGAAYTLTAQNYQLVVSLASDNDFCGGKVGSENYHISLETDYIGNPPSATFTWDSEEALTGEPIVWFDNSAT